MCRLTVFLFRRHLPLCYEGQTKIKENFFVFFEKFSSKLCLALPFCFVLFCQGTILAGTDPSPYSLLSKDTGLGLPSYYH